MATNHQAQKQTSQPVASGTIPSPYNFVPLSPNVVQPEWGKARGMTNQALSHDAPLQDGLSGSLEITLTNHTPLLIAGEVNPQGEKVPLMQGNRYLIPGSSRKARNHGLFCFPAECGSSTTFLALIHW